MEKIVEFSHNSIIQYSQNYVYTALLFACAIASYFLLRKNPRQKHYLDELGGPRSYPILGVILRLLIPPKEIIPRIKRMEGIHGSIVGIWVGNFFPYVFVSDPVVVEKLLTNQIDKAGQYNLLNNWLGHGLLSASRETWTVTRKLITPTFHFKILENFIPVFNEQGSVLLKCLEKEANTCKSFDIYPYLSRCTLDIICETAMGLKINAQSGTENEEYINAVNGLCTMLRNKVLKPWLQIPIIWRFSSFYNQEKLYLNISKGLTEQVLRRRKTERKMEKLRQNNSSINTDTSTIYSKDRKAFLDLLLDTSENNNHKLSDEQIRDEVDTFMFAGHDTTGVNLGWTILLLATHLECQKKLHEEIDNFFDGEDSSKGDKMNSADLSKMKYLDGCIKETLRLYPSAPYIMRHIYRDLPIADGKIIPKGATALIGIYNIHRNPKYFPDPEKFKPERFFLENATERHAYSYIPFSAGKRNCVGQKFAMLEEKVLLTNIFRNYRFEVDQEKLPETYPIPDIILRPQNGINVFLYKR